MLCIKSLIPSLFPFVIITTMLNSQLQGYSTSVLAPIGKLCGIPRGQESIFLLGILGGYPVGAQCIYQSYQQRTIDKKDAIRLLGFCNNAGPSFLFGIIGGMFSDSHTIWLLWGIHILSSLLTGILLPGRSNAEGISVPSRRLSIHQAMKISVKNMANICGWVIWFRVVLHLLFRWILWGVPVVWRVILSGLTELSNGSLMLLQIENPGLRFVFASVFVGFGGICVAMQTASATDKLGLGLYFPGKFIQTFLSFLFSGFVQFIIFDPADQWKIPIWVLGLAVVLGTGIIFIIRKITVDFMRSMMYNDLKDARKRSKACCFEKSSPAPAAIASMLPK